MVSPAVALFVTLSTLSMFTLFGLIYARGRVRTLEDFVSSPSYAGRGMTAATVVASNMGAWILFSPAEAAAGFGGITALMGYAVGSAGAMVLYAVLGPRIRRLIPQGHTLTEYALVRYGPAMYGFVLLVSIFYMFIFLAAEMTGIAGALGMIASVPRWQTAGFIGLFVVLYTGYGGLKASIFTDTLQTLVILPLLGVGFLGALQALDGVEAIYERTVRNAPRLLDLGSGPGLRFGVYVVIAIVGAEMLNQAWWQRIYAARSTSDLRRSFLIAALVIVPMIFLSGLFGMVAVGQGWVTVDHADPGYNADIALFRVMAEAFPAWVTLVVIMLAVCLVMSTADTLINSISSLIAADAPHFWDLSESTLQRLARGLTVLVAVLATWIGSRGYSVLELFLLADLLAAATFVPLLSGLFSRRPAQWQVLTCSLGGLCVGAVSFPILRPLVRGVGIPGWILPPASFFGAFVGAFLISSLGVMAAVLWSGTRYDLSELSQRIRRLDASDSDDTARGGTVQGDLDQ